MYKAFDAARATEVQKQSLDALREKLSKSGFYVELGKVRHNPLTAKLVFTVGVLDDKGQRVSKEREELLANAEKFGVKVADVGRKFGGKTGDKFELVGLKMSRKKNPFVARRTTDGKLFKLSQKRVVKGLYPPKVEPAAEAKPKVEAPKAEQVTANPAAEVEKETKAQTPAKSATVNEPKATGSKASAAKK